MPYTSSERYLRVAEEQAEYAALSPQALGRKIKKLEDRMYAHAANLEFEEAAKLRDTLKRLRDGLVGV